MSFSSEIKEEISKHTAGARHCQLAGMAAILQFQGMAEETAPGKYRILLQSENEPAARKYFTLLRKAFNIDTVCWETGPELKLDGRAYRIVTDRAEEAAAILMAVRWLDEDGKLLSQEDTLRTTVTRNQCCKRSYLKDSFLCIGSMTDPSKSYQLEYVCQTEAQALFLRELMEDFEIHARSTKRKNSYVVYLKGGEEIVDLLNVMEAHVGLMKFENRRIVREMRGTINRKVNCEAANIVKSVNASTRQLEEIEYIRDNLGFDKLPENLREMAEIRLQYPDLTLLELGKRLDPPVGKSGVNHRLRKLSELAVRIRRDPDDQQV